MQGYSSNEQCLSESRLPSRNPRPPIARTRKRRQEKKKNSPKYTREVGYISNLSVQSYYGIKYNWDLGSVHRPLLQNRN